MMSSSSRQRDSLPDTTHFVQHFDVHRPQNLMTSASLQSFRLQADIARTRLERLAEKAIQVSQDYDGLMNKLGQLELRALRRSSVVEHERRLLGLIELLMRDDVRANIITDYVMVFFRLVLLRMREQGQDFADVQQLCKALTEDSVASVFKKILTSLDFPENEQRGVMTLLEAMKHRELPAPSTSEVVTSSPAGDAQISSALLYLRAQQELDPEINASLRRAICVAHESVLSDTAVCEVCPDVDANACNASCRHVDDVTAHVESGLTLGEIRPDDVTKTEKTSRQNDTTKNLKSVAKCEVCSYPDDVPGRLKGDVTRPDVTSPDDVTRHVRSDTDRREVMTSRLARSPLTHDDDAETKTEKGNSLENASRSADADEAKMLKATLDGFYSQKLSTKCAETDPKGYENGNRSATERPSNSDPCFGGENTGRDTAV